MDSTDQPGLYRVDWPDAAFASGAREVILSVVYATAFTEHIRVQLAPAVALAANQSAVTFNGQVKILASANNEGALHLENTGTNGDGLYTEGSQYGQHNVGWTAGMLNTGDTAGQYNAGNIGQLNYGIESYGQDNRGTTAGQRNYSGRGTGQENTGGTGNDISPSYTSRELNPTPLVPTTS